MITRKIRLILTILIVFFLIFIVIQSIVPFSKLHVNRGVRRGMVDADDKNFLIEIESNTNSNEYIDIDGYTSVDRNVLVNYTDFRFLINNEEICKQFRNDELLAVIIVTSYVGHDEMRAAHRQAISQDALKQMGMLRLFLIAEIPPKEKFITDQQVEHEQKLFGDLIQGNFIENYRNLTYKHIMGMKWVTEYCSNSKYIVKIDDDVVYDIYFLQNYLTDFEHKRNHYLLAGFILNGKKPIRVLPSKWYVSRQEYAGDIYPDYLSGWLYISNPKTARALVIESQKTPFFWIDDTYVTGILASKLDIQLQRRNNWFSANNEFIDCCIKDVLTSYLKCDYHIGPNGGENKLIIKFTKAMYQCYDDVCSDRTPENSLQNTCIGQIKDIVKDHGESIVRPIKL